MTGGNHTSNVAMSPNANASHPSLTTRPVRILYGPSARSVQNSPLSAISMTASTPNVPRAIASSAGRALSAAVRKSSTMVSSTSGGGDWALTSGASASASAARPAPPRARRTRSLWRWASRRWRGVTGYSMDWGTSRPGSDRIAVDERLAPMSLERDPSLRVPAPGLGLVEPTAEVGADALGDVGLEHVDAGALAARLLALEGRAEAELGRVEVGLALGLLLGGPVGRVRVGVRGARLVWRVVDARLEVSDGARHRRGLWRIGVPPRARRRSRNRQRSGGRGGSARRGGSWVGQGNGRAIAADARRQR